MSDLEIHLDLDDGDVPAKLERAAVSVERFATRVTSASSSIKRMEDSSKSMLSTMRDLTVSINQGVNALENVGHLATGWVEKIVETNAEFERMVSVMRSLSTAADPLKDATDQVRDLREMAKSAPFALNEIHSAMTRLSSVGLGSSSNIKSLMDAVAAFGGGGGELKRASLAFQEMAGKGVVQMKELRNQLMMAIPSSGTLLARAFGESYSQVMSDIHTGTVDAKTTIAGLMLEFDRAFGGDAQRQMHTFNGLMGQTAVLLQSLAVEQVGQPLDDGGLEKKESFFGALKDQVRDFNGFLQTDTAKVMGQDLGKDLTFAVTEFRKLLDLTISFSSEIKTGAEFFAAAFAGKAIYSGIAGLLGGATSLGARFMSLGASWQSAMKQIEEGSAGAALARIDALKLKAVEASTAVDQAGERAAASAQLAVAARNRAATAPTAAARSVEDQDKLDKAALASQDRVNKARIELQRIQEQSRVDSRTSVANNVIFAEAAAANADRVRSDPRSSNLQRARASQASVEANEDLRIARLDAERIALDRVTAATEKLAIAERERDRAVAESVSTPVAPGRDYEQQAKLNILAVAAQDKAMRDVEAHTAARTRASAAGLAAVEGEMAGTGSRMVQAWGAASAVLPVIASGLGSIIVAAPFVAMAIGLLSDYFDIFNTKAHDAWENLEHYGAASLEAAKTGDPYVQQLTRELAELDQRRKTARDNPAVTPDDFGRMDNADSLDSEYAKKQGELAKAGVDMEKLKQQGMLNDAKAFGAQRQEVLDREFSGYQQTYNKSSNDAAESHTKVMNALAVSHSSTIAETMRYQQDQKERALALYDNEIASLKKTIDEMEVYKQTHKDIADQMKADEVIKNSTTSLADRLNKRDQEANQDMGLFKNVKPLDEKKLIESADQELARLNASIDGYKAGIEGADEAAEKLYQLWLNLRKAGDATSQDASEQARMALDLIKQRKEAEEDYQKIKNGGAKLDKDLQDAIEKNNEAIFKDKHGKESDLAQIEQKKRDGVYAGHGGDTPEAKRLTALREELDRTNGRGLLFSDTMTKAVGPEMLGNVEKLTAAFTRLANPLLALQNGIQGIQAPQTPGNGSIMYGPVGNEPVQWNNPGNINAGDFASRFGGVSGGGKDGRFAMFPTAEAGYQAANANLDAYAREGQVTPRQILQGLPDGKGGFKHGWAPAADGNDPIAYANNIAKMAGVNADQPLPGDKRAEFLRAMTQIEKGKASPFTTEQIRSMISETPGEMAPRRGESDTEKEARLTKELKERETARAKADADKGLKDLEEKYKTKDIGAALEAGGAGKNYASMVAYIREHGADTSIGSIDEKNPKWKSALDIANKRDKDDADVKTLNEKTTAAKSADKVNSEKLTSSSDDLANIFVRLSRNGAGLSDSMQKEVDAAKLRTRQVTDRYGVNSPQGQKAISDEATITGNERSRGAAEDALEASKKTATLREATMSQEQSDTDKYNRLKQKYAEDLAAFKGTADQKTIIEKTFNDNLAAEQAALAAKTPLAKEMQQWGDMTKNLQQSMATTMNSGVDALTSYIMTGKNQWRSFADGITKDLLQMGLKGGISALMGGSGLTGMLGGGGSKLGGTTGAGGAASAGGGGSKAAGGLLGSLGGMFAGVHHTGGIAGGGENSMRYFNAAAFSGAHRFHTGGITGDEVPIIAQKGEGVFTKGQMAAIGKGMKSGASGHTFNFASNVNVNANGGDPMQNEDLARQVSAHVERVTRSTVVSELAQQMRPGNMLATDASNIFGQR